MRLFSHDLLQKHRGITYRTAPGLRLAAVEEAVGFVNQRGFIFFWPIKGFEFASLWAAVAGDRPVADEHDDPGHITWSWKDGTLGLRRWYYGRVLRRRNAMISLELLPFFYALSPNLGDPENDYLEQYLQGSITAEAKAIYEALLREGPLDTIALRKAARLSSSTSDSRFTKALDDLQMEFKVLPVGTAEVGAWRYAFTYDLTHRHFPNLIEQAGAIFESTARHKITDTFFETLGCAPKSQLSRLMGWSAETTEKTLKPFLQNSHLIEATLPGQTQPLIGLPSLLENPTNASE